MKADNEETINVFFINNFKFKIKYRIYAIIN